MFKVLERQPPDQVGCECRVRWHRCRGAKPSSTRCSAAMPDCERRRILIIGCETTLNVGIACAPNSGTGLVTSKAACTIAPSSLNAPVIKAYQSLLVVSAIILLPFNCQRCVCGQQTRNVLPSCAEDEMAPGPFPKMGSPALLTSGSPSFMTCKPPNM